MVSQGRGQGSFITGEKVSQFRKAIHDIARSDIYLFDETDNDAIKKLQSFTRSRILPLASSTHKTEAMVRECSLVSATNCGEGKRSNYVFLRSVNNTYINRIARETREGRTLHANASMKAGKQGERDLVSSQAKKKHKGEKENEKYTRERTRGKHRAQLSLQWIRQSYKETSAEKNTASSRKEIKKLFLPKETEQPNVQRVNLKMEKKEDKMYVFREKNKRQSERGVDRTYRIMGKVPYKILKKDTHTNFIQTELALRALEFGNGKFFKWKEAIDLLKTYESNKKALNPISDFDEYQNSIADP